MEDTDKFANDSFNAVIAQLDNLVLGVGHDTTISHWQKWEKSKDYKLGEVVRVKDLMSGLYYKCTVAGTSGTIEPTNTTVGSIVTDGGVTWEIQELKTLASLHNDLQGRGLNDAHPMSAITGLLTAIQSLASKTDLQTAINNLIDSSPTTLDTLKEIAESLNNDPHLYNTLTTMINQKMDKLSNLEAGITEYPTLTNNGDGSILIQGGKYVVYADDDGSMPLTQYDGGSQTLVMTNRTSNYICLHIVNGVPLFFLASRPLINYSNVLIIATVYRFDNILSFLNWGTTGKATAPKLLKRLNRTERFQRETGLALTESATRQVNITSGVTWFSLKGMDISAFTSSTDDMQLIHHTAGQWQGTPLTQYNNTQYDNGTDLVTLTTNRYAVNYIYREVSDTTKRVFILLGNGDYTLNDALKSTVPVQPALTQMHCILVGRIIVQKGSNTAYLIQSAFDNLFTVGGGSATNASDVTVLDNGNYFTGSDVETVLQELGTERHTNKAVLDKLSEVNNTLYYNGNPIGSGGGSGTTTIPEWASITAYIKDQPVIYQDKLYVALTNHTSLNTFLADMQVGSEKWKLIGSNGGSSGGSNYLQVTKLNASANELVEIPITTTTTFCLPPVDVLKFTAGAQNQVLTSCEFNLTDASKFSVDGITNSPYIVFDGNMYLNTNYSFPMVIKAGWTANGQYSEDTNIDDTKFKIIAGVTIT